MRALASLTFTALLLGACGGKDAPGAKAALTPDLPTTAQCLADGQMPRMNEVQSVGSHNSYKLAIPETELTMISLGAKAVATSLDYSHLPLDQQLGLGMRQLELDVFHDPAGGRFKDPALPKAAASAGRGTPYDTTKMDHPGFKTMHIQDIDQRSHCPLFTDCLKIIAEWSHAHPTHTPLLILINAKQSDIELPGAMSPLAFTPAAFEALDAEIRSVFSEEQLIRPDDVRREGLTLRQSVTQQGWPSLEAAQGKVFFALDENPAVVATYMRGKASLEGLAMFVNSVSPEADHAAYFTLNDPIGQNETIRSAVEAGFIVRTRADADTVEARTNDITRREAALASGAQYVSTDYYVPRADFSDYQVRLPGPGITRCRL